MSAMDLAATGTSLIRADADVFREFMGSLPTAVTVVAACTPDGPLGCTVNSITSLSLRPPTLLVSLENSSRTLAAVLAQGWFGVSVLSWEQRELCRHFATGAADRRFDDVAHCVQHGVPILHGAIAGVVCSVREAVVLGDHTLVAGPPVWHSADATGSPVVFFRRGFRRLP